MDIDDVLCFTFGLFAFVALVFEPLYYFGCDWNGLTCSSADSSWIIGRTRDIWMIYAQLDPLFLDIPMWLRVLSCLEVFVFGPLYAVVAFAISRRSKWLQVVAAPFCGALIYSTVVYFAMEIIENRPNSNYFAIFLINIPWTFVPAALLLRLPYYQKLKSK